MLNVAGSDKTNLYKMNEYYNGIDKDKDFTSFSFECMVNESIQPCTASTTCCGNGMRFLLSFCQIAGKLSVHHTLGSLS